MKWGQSHVRIDSCTQLCFIVEKGKIQVAELGTPKNINLQIINISQSHVFAGQHKAGLYKGLVGREPGQDFWWNGPEYKNCRQVEVSHDSSS